MAVVKTFDNTNGTYTIPAGVYEVTMEVRGGEGGRSNGQDGGRGGRVIATMPVTPGTKLYVYTGGRGGTGRRTDGSGHNEPGGAGGAGGGGTGGQSRGSSYSSITYSGGGGGGLTSVRKDNASGYIYVMAAGGGGASGDKGAGGNGGPTGSNGGLGNSGSTGSVTGGRGASTSSGGAGGTTSNSSANNGVGGGSYVGGRGGNMTSLDGDGGGGGGSGRFGGGGGASSSAGFTAGSGGGGGSNFVRAGLTGVTNDTRPGAYAWRNGWARLTHPDPKLAPNAPTGGSNTTVGDHQVLSWTRNATSQRPYEGYQLRSRSYTGSSWGAWGAWFNTGNGSETGYTTGAWGDNRAVQYQVRARNSEGTSSALTLPVAYRTPATPSSASASVDSSGRVTVSWAKSYYDLGSPQATIQRQTQGGSWSTVRTQAASTSNWRDDNPPLGQVRYRVRITTAGLNSGWATTGYATVQQAPAAPSGLTRTAGSGNSQNLSWTNNTSTGFEYQNVLVQRRLLGGSWATIATLSGTSTSYVDTSASSNSVYEYRVQGRNTAGTSPASNVVRGSTKPATPTNLVASKLPNGDIQLDATNNAPYVSGPISFIISIWEVEDGNAVLVDQTITGSLPWTHEDPDPVKQYRYTMQAVYSPFIESDESEPSNTVVLLTPPDKPTALAPDGEARDWNQPITASWQHNPVDTTPQTAAEIQVRKPGGDWYTLLLHESSVTEMLLPKDGYFLAAGLTDVAGNPAGILYGPGRTGPISGFGPSTPRVLYTVFRVIGGGTYYQSIPRFGVPIGSVSGRITSQITLDGEYNWRLDFNGGPNNIIRSMGAGISAPGTHATFLQLDTGLTTGVNGSLGNSDTSFSVGPNSGWDTSNDPELFLDSQPAAADGLAAAVYAAEHSSQQHQDIMQALLDIADAGPLDIANGDTLEWRVRTKGQHPDWSPWSDTATIVLSSTPTVTINSPADHETLQTSSVTVDWTYYQAETRPQVSFTAELRDAAGKVLETRTGSGTQSAATFSHYLRDGRSYEIRVRATASSGIRSDWASVAFDVDYAPPPTPSVIVDWDTSSGTANVTIDVDDPDANEVDAETVTLLRSDGRGGWRVIVEDALLSQVPSGRTLTVPDLIAPLNVETQYRAIVTSALPSSAEALSERFITESLAVWVNAGAGWSAQVGFECGIGGVSITAGRRKALRNFAGRRFPVEFVGQTRHESWAVTTSLVEGVSLPGALSGPVTTAVFDAVMEIADMVAPVVVRDLEGRRLFASAGDPQFSNLSVLGVKQLSWSFDRVDFDEETYADDD